MVYVIVIMGILVFIAAGAGFATGLNVRAQRKVEDPEYFDELYILKPDEEEVHRLMATYLEGMVDRANAGRREH